MVDYVYGFKVTKKMAIFKKCRFCPQDLENILNFPKGMLVS